MHDASIETPNPRLLQLVSPVHVILQTRLSRLRSTTLWSHNPRDFRAFLVIQRAKLHLLAINTVTQAWRRGPRQWVSLPRPSQWMKVTKRALNVGRDATHDASDAPCARSWFHGEQLFEPGPHHLGGSDHKPFPAMSFLPQVTQSSARTSPIAIPGADPGVPGTRLYRHAPKLRARAE